MGKKSANISFIVLFLHLVAMINYEHKYLESVSTNAIYIIPVSMTLQRAATMQA